MTAHVPRNARPIRKVTIRQCRQAVAREDYIVYGFGKRAVRVVLLANYNTLENTSKMLNVFDLITLQSAIAREVTKRGWKTGVVDISFLNGPAKNARVHLKNPAGHLVRLGELGSVLEKQRFVNK